MKTLLIAALLVFTAGANAGPPGPAGHVYDSPIASIRIDTDGFATVYFEYALHTDMYVTGACRQDDMNDALGFDSKTDAGKNVLAVLLGAKGNDLRVTGYGTGRCMVINGSIVEILHFVRAS